MDTQIAWILTLWIVCFILGIVAHFKQQKDFKDGKIKGVKPSKNLLDWMFTNYDK